MSLRDRDGAGLSGPDNRVPSMARRILTAGFFHETHTFVAETTRWADFDVVRGAEVPRKRGDGSPTGWLLEEAERQGLLVTP